MSALSKSINKVNKLVGKVIPKEFAKGGPASALKKGNAVTINEKELEEWQGEFDSEDQFLSKANDIMYKVVGQVGTVEKVNKNGSLNVVFDGGTLYEMEPRFFVKHTGKKMAKGGEAKPTRNDIEEELNELGVPEADKESNGGRIPDEADYGSWLRKNDKIAFNQYYNEKTQYAKGGDTTGKSQYSVDINYRSTAGNPLTKHEIVYASSIEEATEIVEAKVKKQKNFEKLDGGSAQLLMAKGGEAENAPADGGRLDASYVGYSVSHATLREEDIYDSFSQFLKEHIGLLSESNAAKFANIQEEWATADEETRSDIINGDFFDLMSSIEPEGTSFGAHEGDGSDFGFWKYDDDEGEYAKGGETKKSVVLMPTPSGKWHFAGFGIPLELAFVPKREGETDLEKAWRVGAVKSRIFDTVEMAENAAGKLGFKKYEIKYAKGGSLNKTELDRLSDEADKATKRKLEIGKELGSEFPPYISGKPLRWMYRIGPEDDDQRLEVPEKYVKELDELEEKIFQWEQAMSSAEFNSSFEDEGEYAKGGQAGKTGKAIWAGWSEKQRATFLLGHFKMTKAEAIEEAKNDFSHLPKEYQIAVDLLEMEKKSVKGNKAKKSPAQAMYDEIESLMKIRYGLNPNDFDWDLESAQRVVDSGESASDFVNGYGEEFDLDRVDRGAASPYGFAKGGDVRKNKSKPVSAQKMGTPEVITRGEYLTLEVEKSGNLIISLTDEGKEWVKENGPVTYDNFHDLFEDIQGNSELMYFQNLGDSGLGMTEAPGFTQGMYYGEDYELRAPEDANLWWYPDYMIIDPFEKLSAGEKVVFAGDIGNKYAEGGQTDDEPFVVNGHYTVSNSGGYEIMLDRSGDSARVRDAFGSDNPKTSDWLEIEFVEDEETGEMEPVIDPKGYNIPLNQVMRTSRFDKGGQPAGSTIQKHIKTSFAGGGELDILGYKPEWKVRLGGDFLKDDRGYDFFYSRKEAVRKAKLFGGKIVHVAPRYMMYDAADESKEPFAYFDNKEEAEKFNQNPIFKVGIEPYDSERFLEKGGQPMGSTIAKHIDTSFAKGGEITYEDGRPVRFGIYGSGGEYYITDRDTNRTLPSSTVSHWTGSMNQFNSKSAARKALIKMLEKMHEEQPGYNPKIKYAEGGQPMGSTIQKHMPTSFAKGGELSAGESENENLKRKNKNLKSKVQTLEEYIWYLRQQEFNNAVPLDYPDWIKYRPKEKGTSTYAEGGQPKGSTIAHHADASFGKGDRLVGPAIAQSADAFAKGGSTENQLQALKNAVDNYGLKGYAVHQWQSGDGRATNKFFLVDNKGTSLTGHWDYVALNHFIMGYGKSHNNAGAENRTPNTEAKFFVENLMPFKGSNLEGKHTDSGDYVVLSFGCYPIWYYCTKNKKWYGNADKYCQATALHISQSRPHYDVEMLPMKEFFEAIRTDESRYDFGGSVGDLMK
jgi:hypothetical protein